MDDLKKIIATFIRKEPDEINGDTLINATAIPGSILIHRMYAAINKAGYPIKDYSDIDSYEELLVKLKGGVEVAVGEKEKVKKKTPVIDKEVLYNGLTFTGIDIEHVDNLPKAVDFREDPFYSGNFSDREIAYALLKPDPYETLSGLFAVKESICKADNDFRSHPFNEITIEHTTDGIPVFPGFSLSISHTNGFSVAVAVKNTVISDAKRKDNAISKVQENSQMPTAVNNNGYRQNSITYISLVISILAIAITLFALFFKKSI